MATSKYNLSPEQVRQIILARVAELKRKRGVLTVLEKELLKLYNKRDQLPKGSPRSAGSWRVLEDLLGRETIDRWRG